MSEPKTPGERLTRRDWLAGSLALGGAVLPNDGTTPALAASALGIRARLSLNENPLGPSPVAIAAIRGQLGSLDRYSADQGDALQSQIATLENVSPVQVILGEILDGLGLQLALSGPRGGEFVYSEPGYTALVDAVSPGGGVTVAVPLNERQENDLPAVAARVNGRTRAVYIVNPHNPSGTVSGATVFLRFVKETAARTLVIVDEAYLEFLADFADRTAATLVRQGVNVIVFRTFGKIYGLAGLAIGYAIAPKTLATALKAKGLGATLELNRLSVAAAAASLRDGAYIGKMRAQVSIEREKWNALFAKHKLRHADSVGNFVFFETGRPQGEFAAALRSKGIDIGRAFSPLDRWARISIGLATENALARAVVDDLMK